MEPQDNLVQFSAEHQQLMALTGRTLVPLPNGNVTDSNTISMLEKLYKDVQMTDEVVSTLEHKNETASFSTVQAVQTDLPVDTPQYTQPQQQENAQAMEQAPAYQVPSDIPAPEPMQVESYRSLDNASLAHVPFVPPQQFPLQQQQQIPKSNDQLIKEILSPGFVLSMGAIALAASFILGGGFAPKPIEQQQIDLMANQQKQFMLMTEQMLITNQTYAQTNKRNVCIMALDCPTDAPIAAAAAPEAVRVSQPVDSSTHSAKKAIAEWRTQGYNDEQINQAIQWQRSNNSPKLPSADALAIAFSG
jgi:hypothetical protein